MKRRNAKLRVPPYRPTWAEARALANSRHISGVTFSGWRLHVQRCGMRPSQVSHIWSERGESVLGSAPLWSVYGPSE